MILMLEITLHDGPARLGKWNDSVTPLIMPRNSAVILEDEPMPYDVPRELAEWAVESTLKKARENEDKSKVAVIQGSKYLDLRLNCASELENMGYRIFLVANTEKLLKKPRDLIETIVNLRDTLNPNSAIYFPFVELNFVPLLAYMGVDMFSEAAGDLYSKLEVIVTPDHNYELGKYHLYEMNSEEIREYNQKSLDFVLREVREHIKNGTLRNLVEMRSGSTPEVMSALRILDLEYQEWVESYTSLH